MMRRQDHNQTQQSCVLHELSSLVFNILRSPPSPVSAATSSAPARRRTPPPSAVALPQITPAGLASLMMGISLALMLCGSVTFFIGFMLLPWVIGLVLVFYFVGLVSSLSLLGRTVLCYALPPSSPSSPSWKFM